MSQNEFSPADTIETDAAPEAQQNAEAPANEALAEILLRKRKNGLSLAEAIEFALAHEALPAVELAWEKPLADTENMRLRKIQTAQALAGTFVEARDVLSRPAGTITTARWTPAWQRDAEKAVREFSASAETLSASAADFTAATGLLPLAGTLKEFRALLGLVGALIAVRDEDSALVLGADAAEKLSALREAATLSENLGRHESLLSLPYSENAAESPALEPLLKTWREAENARAFPRWVKRRKVVRALRELAGGTKQKPLDPRVDLGNLIAVRTCRGELAEKFSELAKAFPSLVGIAGALPRIEALEKARDAVAAALERLENFPEKREAWNTVIARWLAGTDPAFAAGGATEKALAEANAALAKFNEAKNALAEIAGTALPSAATETAETAGNFAQAMLADIDSWKKICEWNAAALAAERRGMRAFAENVRNGNVPADRVEEFFKTDYCRRWADAVCESEPEILDFVSEKNLSRDEKFRALIFFRGNAKKS